MGTYGILAVTFAVYVLQFIPGLGITQLLAYAGVYSMPIYFEPWRMLTALLVHSTSMVLHILLNMYTLWIFGRILEPFIGTRRFLTLYVLAGLGGSIGVLWLSDPLTPVVGASGAIFGVIGAFVVIQRSMGGSAPQLYLLLGINLLIGFLPGMSISWQAHVGGLAVGIATGLIYSQTRRPDQRRAQLLGIIALTAVLVILSLRYVVLG